MADDTEPAGRVPTLADVARAARVSSATVSRCLNEPHRVTQQTRDRVMRVVRELGYAPNFGARALAARRTDTFGAVIPTMDNAIFARGLQAFQEEMGRHGITLLVASSSYDPALEQEQIRNLAARGVDGVMLIGHDRPEDSYQLLQRRGVPYVVTWSHDPSQPHPSIGFDNRKAMMALMEQVIRLGHRHVGLLSGVRYGNDRARLRAEGVAESMQRAGIAADNLTTVEARYSIDAGAAGFAQLMQRRPRPTVVVCGNDVLAAGALRQARAMGLNVPGDVSITGFDDIDLAEIVTPGLTTVHVPHRQMGRGAAEILMKLRDGQDPVPPVELEASILWRESLGAAP